MSILIVTYLILAQNIVTLAKDFRIIGGENGDITEIPYIVSLRNIKKKEHFCSGAIISNYHILTAAHCLQGLSKSIIKVYAGSNNSRNYSISHYNIVDTAIHPKFIGQLRLSSTVHNDIALLTVDKCIQFTESQYKIDLPTSDIEPDQSATISGWGWTRYPLGMISPILQKASMKILSNTDCAKRVSFPIFEQQVCAFQKIKVGTCYGDSGGPLASNRKLVGISSFTTPCAAGSPDIYSRVFSYLDFIKSSMLNTNNLFGCLSL